jgi:hypothetical protein
METNDSNGKVLRLAAVSRLVLCGRRRSVFVFCRMEMREDMTRRYLDVILVYSLFLLRGLIDQFPTYSSSHLSTYCFLHHTPPQFILPLPPHLKHITSKQHTMLKIPIAKNHDLTSPPPHLLHPCS